MRSQRGRSTGNPSWVVDFALRRLGVAPMTRRRQQRAYTLIQKEDPLTVCYFRLSPECTPVPLVPLNVDTGPSYSCASGRRRRSTVRVKYPSARSARHIHGHRWPTARRWKRRPSGGSSGNCSERRARVCGLRFTSVLWPVIPRSAVLRCLHETVMSLPVGMPKRCT